MPGATLRVCRRVGPRCFAALCLGVAPWTLARAELPSPQLNGVFPAGGQAGSTVEVVVEGVELDGLAELRFGPDGVTASHQEGARFTVTIAPDTPHGSYDVRAAGQFGLSSPRTFVVGGWPEQVEADSNDELDVAQQVSIDTVINGRIEKPGDVDCYRFAALGGQRIVLDCRAARIDSQLRGVLELYDGRGLRLATNRGEPGLDPLLDFVAPTTDEYVVKLFDLTFAGGAAHFYRLEIDTSPRLEFAVPCVLQRGRSTRVSLFGRNLLPASAPIATAVASTASVDAGVAAGEPFTTAGSTSAESPPLDRIEVDVDVAPQANGGDRVGLRASPTQLAVDAFAYRYRGAGDPILLSATDAPVVMETTDNHSPAAAQEIVFPCDVAGQLEAGPEQDWFALRASRGDVLWIEAFGERIGSPVDLDLVVLDPTGERELTRLTDCLDDQGGYRFPLNHLDPVGRWVAPADGRYLVMVRNLTGGLYNEASRLYRLSIRREEPDFCLAAISRRTDRPAGSNVWRGGREMIEVIAVRRRGFNGAIRVVAENLPAGVHCPETWIGPGVDRAPLILSADPQCAPYIGALSLVGQSDWAGAYMVRPVRGGGMVWAGQATGSGRLTDEIPLALAPPAPLRLTATAPDDPIVYQNSVLDVAIDVDRMIEGHAAPIELTCVGLPQAEPQAIATIPVGAKRGWISVFVPASLTPGDYTFAVQGDTEGPFSAPAAGAKPTNVAIRLFSDPITIHVAEARIALGLDPRTPKKISRGQILQLPFTAERKHGFIGKIHTELAAPGGVIGLRGRGVTLVGQTDSGVIQVIATDDAPLGQQPFLRLEAVGTVEDRPVYRASRFLNLEITE